MIVYNVTLAIQPDTEQEFMDWLREIHLPEVLETGLFLKAEIFKIIENPDERIHNSYAVQYQLESWENYIKYRDNHAAALQAKTKEKYGDKVLSFRTFLEKL
ncbi:DUF4286 family protein [bacterium]|jgi:hypothetical protein|nr:DUF4286 family protein [bacterium]